MFSQNILGLSLGKIKNLQQFLVSFSGIVAKCKRKPNILWVDQEK